MMALYTSKAFARDTIALLYYSIVLTGITVFVSAFIGIIQVLSLVENVAEPEGPFWDGVGAIGDHFEIIGGSICGLFLLVGIGSVFVYKPWRRRMDRRNGAMTPDGEVIHDDETRALDEASLGRSGDLVEPTPPLEGSSDRAANLGGKV